MHLTIRSKEEALRTMQWLATGCVALAFAVRIGMAFVPDSGWAGYVRAFSEAAVVGGLADWFAVTALFRHPLGLPIPHTRILPQNKDRIAASLSNFVVTNFLNREVLERELAKMDLSRKAADLLALRADSIATRAAEYLPRLFSAIDDEDISRFLEVQVTERLRMIRVAPLAGRLIELLTSSDKHERIVNDLLKLGQEALSENRDVFTSLIRKQIPVPDQIKLPVLGNIGSVGAVKDMLSDMIAREAMKRILQTIGEVRDNADHEIRARIRERIARLATDLKESPEMLARGEELKNELFANPHVTAYASQIWGEIKTAILDDAARPDGQIRQHLANGLRRAAAQVKADDAIRDKMNEGLRAAAVDLVSDNAHEFARVIDETVKRWDGEELANKLEIEVGRDLQFVRLNGTLVGGLLGAVLHSLTSFL